MKARELTVSSNSLLSYFFSLQWISYLYPACRVTERAVQEEILFEVSVCPQQLWVHILKAEQVPSALWSGWQGRVSDRVNKGKFRVSWGLIRTVHMERSQVEVERRGVWREWEGGAEYQRGIRWNSLKDGLDNKKRL